MKYDYLLVGSGLFNAVVASELRKAGKSVLVVERRNHIGGNVYTKRLHNIDVHCYGAHIFRTNDIDIWEYVNSIVPFRNFINSPMANYRGELYNLPFNMNTFNKLWKVKTPDEAQVLLEFQCERNYGDDLESWALSTVGKDIYEKFIKYYTEKQWGKKCSELPKSIMKRIPIRYTYDNNYYADKQYQGIPVNGYTEMIERLFDGCDIIYNTDGKKFIQEHKEEFDTCVYTGCIDEFCDYVFGPLEYRSLLFDHKYKPDIDNYQGVAVMNYTYKEPYTRIIEHKHFTGNTCPGTIISYEIPVEYNPGINEPIYPVASAMNDSIYFKYLELCESTYRNIHFCGRLGSYKYTDMEETIKNAKKFIEEIIK